MGSCALPLHSAVLSPLEEWSIAPQWLLGPLRSLGFHLIKLL